MKDYEFYYTQDGSIGLYSYADEDVYHSKFGAITESWEKFVLPSGIARLINTKENINVLDVCYGVGYNTKALMSYVINKDEKFLKRKNIIEKFLKKIKKIFLRKNEKLLPDNINIDSTDNDNPESDNLLSQSDDSIDYNNLTKFNIDCLDINEELIKISPFLKTFLTPQEIFIKIVPNIFSCFDSYWIVKKWLKKFAYKYTRRNSKRIKELLDLKFNNEYDLLNNDYKIHKYVNYILTDKLIDKYKLDYIDVKVKKMLRERRNRKFFDKHIVKYADFKQDFRYDFISRLNPVAFLHNIYYDYVSKRYKKMKFNDAERLFNISFFVNDARKSILSLNRQYDFIFLDAFTYSKAPELWTVEFIAELYKKLSPSGILMTYSNSALVRNTFIENGFYIGKIVDEKSGKNIGTVAAKEKSLITVPLSSYEMGLCSTKAGIPYHDPSLSLSRELILKRREADFKESELMSATKYMNQRLNQHNENEENNDV